MEQCVSFIYYLSLLTSCSSATVSERFRLLLLRFHHSLGDGVVDGDALVRRRVVVRLLVGRNQTQFDGLSYRDGLT